MIKITNLTFSYLNNNKKVLDNINISINEGEITTILGLNGSGKTTLIKLLASLLKPKEGSIKIKDKDLKDLSIKEKSELIAYVPQLSKIDYDYVVFDYLSFSLANKVEYFKSPSKKQLEQMLEVTTKFNINHLLDKKLNNLSGGERQIVSICGALIQESPIIILDEPTSALDLKNQHFVIKLIKQWNKDKNKTFILSTHNPNHALSLGGNTIILHNNNIIKSGLSREIVTVDSLKPVYGNIIDYAKNIEYDAIVTIE